MELKDFQQRVLDILDDYLDELTASHANFLKIAALKQENPDLDLPLPDFTERAWDRMRVGATGRSPLPSVRSDIPFSPRVDGIGRSVPSLALKVPTGGGKTILAANSVSRIMSKWLRRNSGFVLWIVQLGERHSCR